MTDTIILSKFNTVFLAFRLIRPTLGHLSYTSYREAEPNGAGRFDRPTFGLGPLLLCIEKKKVSILNIFKHLDGSGCT